jgi:hypothetical protein
MMQQLPKEPLRLLQHPKIYSAAAAAATIAATLQQM